MQRAVRGLRDKRNGGNKRTTGLTPPPAPDQFPPAGNPSHWVADPDSPDGELRYAGVADLQPSDEQCTHDLPSGGAGNYDPAHLVPPGHVACPFRIVVDTREQRPYTFQNIPSNADTKHRPFYVPTVRGTVPVGDYMVQGWPRFVVERKSKADLFASVAKRDNFVGRLAKWSANCDQAVVLVEAEMGDILGLPIHDDGQIRAALQTLELLPTRTFFEPNGSPGVMVDEDRLRVACDRLRNLPPAYHETIRSEYPPKSLGRTIQSWIVNYPKVHWVFMPGRAAAERYCFWLLWRWWERCRRGL